MKKAYVKPNVLKIACEVEDPIMGNELPVLGNSLLIPSMDIGEEDDLE